MKFVSCGYAATENSQIYFFIFQMPRGTEAQESSLIPTSRSPSNCGLGNYGTPAVLWRVIDLKIELQSTVNNFNTALT